MARRKFNNPQKDRARYHDSIRDMEYFRDRYTETRNEAPYSYITRFFRGDSDEAYNKNRLYYKQYQQAKDYVTDYRQHYIYDKEKEKNSYSAPKFKVAVKDFGRVADTAIREFPLEDVYGYYRTSNIRSNNRNTQAIAAALALNYGIRAGKKIYKMGKNMLFPREEKDNKAIRLPWKPNSVDIVDNKKAWQVKGFQYHDLPFSERDSSSEIKCFDAYYDNLVTNMGRFSLCNWVQTGTDFDDVVGTKIIMKKLIYQVYLNLTSPDTNNVIRIMIVYDYQPTSSPPIGTDLLVGTNALNFTNLSNRDRWLILYDKFYTVNVNNPNQIVQGVLDLKNLETTCSRDTVTYYPVFGRLYIFMTHLSSVIYTIATNTRVRYCNY